MFGPKTKKGAEKAWAHDATVYNFCYLTSINLIQLRRVRRARDILRIQMRKFVNIRGNLERNIIIYHRMLSCEDLKCIVVE
jgi:hypothetical protein